MSSIIHDFPATGTPPLGLHCIISIAERWTSCWFVPLGGPSRGALRLLRSSRYALTQPDAFGAGASRDGLRSFDKASAHRLGNGFNARLDAAKPARIPGLPMADFLMV